jgi:hypothetical protein
METFRLQIPRKLTSGFRMLIVTGIVTTVSCAGCGAKNINECPGNATSSTQCQIIINGGPASDLAPSDGSNADASANGSAPAASPSQGSSAPASPGPATTSSNAPIEKSIPLMVPILSQPGWNLVWRGQKSIGPQGVIFSEVNPISGPETGNGGEFNLQYVAPGSGSGWGSNLNYLYYWTNSYRPGPGTIAGILQNQDFSGDNPAGMLAHVGDRLFAAMDTEAEGFNIAFFMQVIKVEQDSVLVDMWVWNSV